MRSHVPEVGGKGIPADITYFISMAYRWIRGIPEASSGVPRVPKVRHCYRYSHYYPEGTSQPVALAGTRSPDALLWEKNSNGETHTLLYSVVIVVITAIANLKGIAMKLRTIEIDFDIHKLIEADRTGFDEPEYVVLRRLLGLKPKEVDIGETTSVEGNPFIEDGVEVMHGSDARMRYQRGTQLFEGKFLDGKLVVGGNSYPTLSAAASDLARTKDGKRTSLNGWIYWEVKAPGTSRWKSMSDLREKVKYQLANIEKFV